MAKESKTKTANKPDPKEEKQIEREFKYGVEDIAAELGIKPASVRVQLRNKGIEKAGKSYGWNNKADLKEVIDQIRAEESKGKKSKKDEDEKPAKSKSKKDEKVKAKSKKSKPAEDDEDEDED